MYELHKILGVAVKCILFHDTKTTIVSKDENNRKLGYNQLLKYIPLSEIGESKNNKIEFVNGSSVDFCIPQEPSNRGKRSQLPIYYDLVDRCDISQEELNEVLEPYINKKGQNI